LPLRLPLAQRHRVALLGHGQISATTRPGQYVTMRKTDFFNGLLWFTNRAFRQTYAARFHYSLRWAWKATDATDKGNQ